MSDVTVTSEADAVNKAAKWAEALLARVHHGPGDNIEAAMHRAERKYGIPVQTFWSLRYRPPKEMGVAAWAFIKSVYDAECGRQEARLRHELELAKALQGSATLEAAISEAEAALGTERTGTEG